MENPNPQIYTQVTLSIPYEWQETITAQLLLLDYEGFVEEGNELIVYTTNYQADELNAILSPYNIAPPRVEIIENQNWNANWEASYESISIGNFCHIYPHFRTPEPGFEVYLQITPQMSFGTGHHETTQMIIQLSQNIDFKNKNVLDMGCGTGVLGIMAAKRNARQITFIDYDPLCTQNTLENIEANGFEAQLNTTMHVLLGDSSAIPQNNGFDIIFANINRNILLEQGTTYAQNQNTGGELLISGFFDFDNNIILAYFQTLNYAVLQTVAINNWQAARLQKIA